MRCSRIGVISLLAVSALLAGCSQDAEVREWMEQNGTSKSVAVHMIGKVKTTVQMVAIPFLLYDGRLFGFIDTGLLGQWLWEP